MTGSSRSERDGSGRRTGGLAGAETVALALSVVWLLGVAIFFFAVGFRAEDAPPDPVRGLTVVVAVFMPLALIWIAALAVNSARVMRDESARLSRAVEEMRKASVAQTQASAVRPSFEKKLDQIVKEQQRTGAALARFTSVRQGQAGKTPRRAAPAAAPEPEDRRIPPPADPPAEARQGDLSLPTRDDLVDPIPVRDFIVALNFPQSEDDKEGFRALRRAMRDRRAAQLVQASQDLLTLLSQEGVYMDDLPPEPTDAALWRRFARGERGRALAGLAAIRDRSALALAASRMRKDPIFRDTAHHFLRKFDKVFAEFEKTAEDSEIAALSDTRTARAFMLIAQVTGGFGDLTRR